MALFAHLALQFGSHPENLATEALGYILKQSAAARSGLASGLGKAPVNSPADLRFETQDGSDQGRPDLVGFNHEGRKALLVEAKFDAGFTELQPVGYLDQLVADGILLVVAPAKRLPYLWNELLKRLRGSNLNIDVTATLGESGEIAIGARKVALWSWHRLLHCVELGLSNEPEALADLRQLRGLCSRMDDAAFVPVNSEELSNSLVRRVHEFGLLVDTITDRLASAQLFEMKGLRSAASNGWYGRYARLHGVGVMLQVNTWKWSSMAATPIWLNIYGTAWTKSPPELVKKVLVEHEITHPNTIHQGRDGYPTVALHVSPGAERHELVASVCAQIQQIGELLRPLAGGQSIEGAPADVDAADP